MSWFLLLATLVSPFWSAAINETLAGQNQAVQKAQYGEVIRPTRITSGLNETELIDHLMEKCMAQASPMVVEKQAEIDKLKSEMDKMKEEIEKLNENLKELKLKNKGCDNVVSRNRSGNTILILGNSNNHLVLSSDRSKWIMFRWEIEALIEVFFLRKCAVYLNDEIYSIGGWINYTHYPQNLYKFDKNSLKWIRLADMNIGRRDITYSCLASHGYIWVFGGRDKNSNSLKSVERYDPKEDTWTLMPNMSNSRTKAAVSLWSGRFVISGGYGDVGCFNPEDSSWADLPDIPNGLYGHSLVSYKNKLIAMGGIDRNFIIQNSVLELDPNEKNSTWKSLMPMKHRSFDFSGIILDNEIYAIGGRDAGTEPLDRVEIFDGNNWRDGPPLPCKMRHASALIIPHNLADRLCSFDNN